jgi:LmbE family N-acetylglucosaminyl deacetylase
MNAGRAALVQINVAEINARINPQDHSDHLMTAKAALDAVKDFKLRSAGLLRRLRQLAAAAKSRCAETGHGKLGAGGNACWCSGSRPQHVVAPL